MSIYLASLFTKYNYEFTYTTLNLYVGLYYTKLMLLNFYFCKVKVMIDRTFLLFLVGIVMHDLIGPCIAVIKPNNNISLITT